MSDHEIPVVLMPDEKPSDELLAEYIEISIKDAVITLLCDGTYFAEIPGFQGAWANADSPEECRQELKEVLEDWIILGIDLGHEIPVLPSMNLAGRMKAV